MAFDLVAKLKLQDDFTDRLKRVGQQLDRVKNQVSKAAGSTSELGKKFSSAGSVATAALGKIKDGAGRMGSAVTKAGTISTKSLGSIGNIAVSLGKKFSSVGNESQRGLSKAAKAAGVYRDKLGKLRNSQGAFIKETTKMRSVFSNVGAAGKRALDGIKNGVTSLPSKFSSMGSRARNSINSGIKGPASSARGAILGIASAVGVVAVASKGFQLLKGAIEGAVARYDTLNQFPKVMEKIGFSTDKSAKSISRLAEGIDGLPTTLGEVAATTQRIAVMTGDLDRATETTLALNNALIASGADAEKASRGTEQFIKMMATGKVNLESWTTLQETMGLALNDLAKAFGFAGKSAQNDLYKALKDGKITFEDFNEKLIELSKAQGGFAETALDGAGGIATAWKNIRTAITNGVAGSIAEIDKALGGTGEIEDALKRVKGLVKSVFNPMNKFIGKSAKLMKKLYDDTKPFHSILKDLAQAALIFGAVLGGMAMAAGAIAGIGALFAVIGSGVGIAILAIAGLVTGFVLAYQKIEPFRNAVQDLLGTFKDVFNVLKSGSGGGDLMKKMGFSNEQVQIARDFVDNITETFSEVKDGFKQLGDFFVHKGTELAPTLDKLAEAFAIGKDVVVNIFQTLWAVLGPIFSALKNAIMIVADIATIAFSNIIVPVLKFAMQNFQLLWTIVGPILKLLGSAIGAAFGVLKLVWDTILKPVVKFLSGLFAKTLEKIGEKIDSVKGNFEMFGGAIEKVAGWFDSFRSALSKFKVPNWLSKLGGGGTVKFEGGGDDDGGGEGRYNGIKYVPRDGYPIRAHRGERVLTAKENKEYGKGGKGVNVMVTGNEFHVRQESDIDKIANIIAREFVAAVEGGA